MTTNPDPDHDAVVEAIEQHLVVVAPPGTGKTHLSVRLAGSLAPTLEPSERVLLVTFSNQARVQLEREAARQLRPDVRRQVEVTNYHRVFWRAVLAYRRALHLPLTASIGSRRQRLTAFEAADANAVRELKRNEGLLDALAEHAFASFHDDRTPEAETLERLLAVVETEHRAGRLVFDDLGALVWQLFETYPTVATAFANRYPVVIADEHQDASALQDAFVRRLGWKKLVVLADPMQLIHGFRGARMERREQHETDGARRLELRTGHRWHGDAGVAEWLLAVRARLDGQERAAPAPQALQIVSTHADRGFNGVKPHVRNAISEAFSAGADSVAVLARNNTEVAQLRNYLSTQRMHPRQLGGGDDFEEAREDIEQLPLLADRETAARHALERVVSLVPTLSSGVREQVARRLTADGINLSRQRGTEARGILDALSLIYEHGPGRYVHSVVKALDSCAKHGHNLPRAEAVRTLRETAESLQPQQVGLDEVLDRYSERAIAASHRAPRHGHGLFVMTVHQAKGKEFDAVVLANAVERNFPDDEESRRLFYVAVTRATTRWVVVAPEGHESPLIRSLAG